ncbi:MAG: EexN family lipoprotein, partial [Pseudomonadota bacterium]
MATILTACNQVQDKQYFLTHPQELKKTLNQCVKMPNQGLDNARCKQASLAYSEFEALLLHSQQNGQAFGQKIIQLQLKIANLKAKIAKLKNNPKQTPRRGTVQELHFFGPGSNPVERP